MNAFIMYSELRNKYSLNELANKLQLHTGTLKRWESLQKVPQDYIQDLNFLLDNKYELKAENFRTHNEFFTKPEIAKYCFESFLHFLIYIK